MTMEVRPIRPTTYTSAAGATVNIPASLSGLDFTTVREVLAVPGANQQIIVTGVIFSNATAAAITMVLQEDTGGTPLDIFPDLSIPINDTVYMPFPQGIPVTKAKNLGVKSSSNDVGNAVIIFGYTDTTQGT